MRRRIANRIRPPAYPRRQSAASLARTVPSGIRALADKTVRAPQRRGYDGRNEPWSSLTSAATAVSHAAGFAVGWLAAVTVFLSLNIPAFGDQPRTNKPAPIYQVLDEKPADMMLNYFREQARPLPKNHAAPKSREEWERRRVELRRQLWDSLGKFPLENPSPLNARITGRIDHGDHVIEKILYESMPGLYITALAYVPKRIEGRVPAVICVNGHWPEAKATELIQRRCSCALAPRAMCPCFFRRKCMPPWKARSKSIACLARRIECAASKWTVSTTTIARCARSFTATSPSICLERNRRPSPNRTICRLKKELALRVGLPEASETMQSLTFRRAKELVDRYQVPESLTAWEGQRERILSHLKNDIFGGFPDPTKCKRTLLRKLAYRGYPAEHWTLEPEPGVIVPAVLLLPNQSSGKTKLPGVIVVNEDGKKSAFERGLVDALLSSGRVVLAIDYRGAGETAGTVPSIEYGPGTPEYNLSNYGLFIGRPVMGMWTFDVRCATDLLASRAEVDATRISIAGRGRGALAALLAAACDQRIRSVALEDMLATWVFKEEFRDIGLAFFIPASLPWPTCRN